MAIIDAKGLVLGRLASHAAKRLEKGEEIIIINAEKAIIVGNKDAIISEYRKKREIGGPRKGPFFPRMPDRILKRTIRGMIPYQKPKGRQALKRLKVYIAKPRELDGEIESIEDARKVVDSYIELGEVSKALGAKF